MAKNIFTPLGITAASENDPGIQKKIHGSGTTTLTISSKEMNDITKIVQVFEDSNILLKGVNVMMKIMKLVEYKYLLVSLKTDKNQKNNQIKNQNN